MGDMVRRALVLGGGGITGIAWEVGLLAGLADHGVDLTDADLVVGTSAGSLVGAEIRQGVSLADLDASQRRPHAGGASGADDDGRVEGADLGRSTQLRWMWESVRSGRDLERLGRRMGALAHSADDAGRVPTQDQRTDVIASRLSATRWPERPLAVTAVETTTGRLRAFTAADGVPLVDALAASCAVAGVFAPVRIGDRSYIDGGTRSSTNADLARGYDRVVVLAPLPRAWPANRQATTQLADLGVPGVVVGPDRRSREAIGPNVLDPTARAATAAAARAQAGEVADEIAAAWA